MNFNNYNNPYNQYPYTNYMNNNVQYQQPQQMQQPIQQQTNYLPLTFVNGIEGAKAFIVGANQTIYLKDSDSNVLFEKRADAQGKYTLIAYELKSIELNNIGKEKKEQEIMYMTYNDFKKYEMRFEDEIEELKSKIKQLKEIKEGNVDE